MNKKLLHKTLKSYLTFSIVVLIISAPMFYFFTSKLYIDEVDDTLLLHKDEFIQNVAPSFKIIDIPYWNKYNRDIKINKSENISKDIIKQNGDEITVIQSSEEVKNRLEVSGDVERPGNFEWKEGMKVTDLLDKAKLKRTTKRNIGFVQSLNSDNSYSLPSFNIDSITEDKNSTKNYLLSPNDILIILSQIDFTQYYKINVSGAGRNPGEFDFDPAKNIKVKDAVTLAGGLKVDALSKAYVVRTDTATGIRNYALFNIQNALTDINSSDNLIRESLIFIAIFFAILIFIKYNISAYL